MHYHVDAGEDFLEPETTPFETLNEAIHFAANLVANATGIEPSEQHIKRTGLRRLAREAGLHHSPEQSITLDLPDGQYVKLRTCVCEECWIEIDLRRLGLLSSENG